jgi:hypothetical protein
MRCRVCEQSIFSCVCMHIQTPDFPLTDADCVQFDELVTVERFHLLH